MADVTRHEAIETLESGHRKLEELLAALSEEELTRGSTIGGGDWSAKDLIGHMASWEEAAIDAVADLRRGEKPRIEAYFAEDSAGVDRFNAERMAEIVGLSLAEVRGRADGAHRTLIGQIQVMTDDEWQSPVSYEAERRRRVG